MTHTPQPTNLSLITATFSINLGKESAPLIITSHGMFHNSLLKTFDKPEVVDSVKIFEAATTLVDRYIQKYSGTQEIGLAVFTKEQTDIIQYGLVVPEIIEMPEVSIDQTSASLLFNKKNEEVAMKQLQTTDNKLVGIAIGSEAGKWYIQTTDLTDEGECSESIEEGIANKEQAVSIANLYVEKYQMQLFHWNNE